MTSDILYSGNLLPAMAFAMVAGVLSFLSPCVLPIVPPYLAYMGGVSLNDLGKSGRGRVIFTAFAFVLGLSTVFVLLGLGASELGRRMAAWRDMMTLSAGVLIMVFGAHFLGVIRIGFLQREARFDAGDRGGSFLGAYLLGLAFAFGWTPCLGPVLGAILGLAANEASMSKGALLLAAYAVGLGLPFLLVAGFFPYLKGALGWLKRHLDAIERISGLLLWTVGLMMITGQFSKFSFWLLTNIPWLQNFG